ncbi:MFS transporter [Paenibacillus sp. JCM 10914]|uniref:MFS transporter n=1 Tax=Paenibacillus sp. JCM 10914 TaxID=1236974 RepID=UPI0003CC6963|nr:MFS transporter [Paenibacillus sp. JCM 10914]GAE05594.1 permeases of the major facilitator superfamily [Paenibacillus sp. JCM 10914]
MATWFLIIIYLAFISLGLPDALLGSAWPVMRFDVGASIGSAGLVAMVIAGGTIVSSLASGSLVKKIGTGNITLISCFLTAGALLGFSLSPSLAWLIVMAIPLGLGAGAVDAALNHYVANHYKAHHMSWLHCFWGVGATMSPIIMSFFIANHNSWRSGYTTVAIIQFSLVVVLLLTLPLWKRVAKEHPSTEETEPANVADLITDAKPTKLLRLRGVKFSLAAFLFYCGVETTVGLWGASFLVGARAITPEMAAGWISLYFGGITLGRFVAGFVTFKMSNRTIIRIGQLLAIMGGLILFLPVPNGLLMSGLILIGLGLAPIYPALLHETPDRFGKEHSAKLMGYQMAVAYTGTTLLPPLFGVLASQTSIGWFPVVILIFVFIMMLSTERVNHILQQRKSRHV